MRGHDEQTHHMFSYLSPEQRVPADHPLRAVRALTDHALKTMSRRFAGLYAKTGRPSIPPEQLLRALLLQVLYTIRSERLLMEELNDNLLFRWFVGLNMDDPVWHPTTLTKNRDRLLAGDVAAAFFDAVQAHRGISGARGCSLNHRLRKHPLLSQSVRPTRRGPPNARRRHCCWRPARRRATGRLTPNRKRGHKNCNQYGSHFLGTHTSLVFTTVTAKPVAGLPKGLPSNSCIYTALPSP